MHWRHSVGGGAPVNFGRPVQKIAGGAAWAAKRFFSKTPEKMSFCPQKNFKTSFSHRKLQQNNRSNIGIGGAPTNHRRQRRGDQKKSTAAPTNCRQRRGVTDARLIYYDFTAETMTLLSSEFDSAFL